MKHTLAILVALLAASPAAAHLPEGDYGSFLSGVTHPLFGLDHVLAMIAVGLWASQIGGRALWAVPTAFVGAMVMGFLAALAGLNLPFVETMIMASTMVLGLVVALALRPSPALAMGAVAVFALFHGHAHGSELGQAQAVQFGVGFAIATALLHAAGISVAFTAARETKGGAAMPLRVMGGATALIGAFITFG
ncbi:MAG: HupE/UreJ family protein [Roseovarius sp.]|nr:HupE/UreJ family protein [Roseovarius sp.]